ncbi:10696_t:CDS:2 [Rhizophagus irregularis]|nr:10696_t:CDS:2 [Rhizophagus irregularis]
MIFTESKRSTEPYSFIFLKKLCSLSFILILLYYTYNQFSQYYVSISNPNINFYKLNVDEFINTNISIIISVRGEIANCNYINNNNDKGECRKYKVPNDNNLHYSFNHSSSGVLSTTIKITPKNTIPEIYLGGFELDKYYPSESASNYPNYLINIMKEQTMIVYYSPIIKTDFNNDQYVNFNVRTATKTPSATTTNTISLTLIQMSTDIYYQEETYNDLGSVMSDIGGFFSSLSGIFIFLFGASKLAPWGFLQTGRAKNVTLEERIQSIENLLEEYYLDTKFLNILLEEDKDNDDKVQIITAA